jgi:hypothetical protein
VQTREHLFKNCPRWKLPQKALWVEVRRDTGKGKNRFKIQDLFADERCIRTIMDFLRATKAGRRAEDREQEEKNENRVREEEGDEEEEWDEEEEGDDPRH